MPRNLTHDEWYAFMELCTGLREDILSRNPGCIRELRTTALDLSEHPNPFDTIEALRTQVGDLETQVADLTKKAAKHDRPKRTPRAKSAA